MEPCWTKNAAVVLLWCGFAHQTGHQKKKVLRDWLKSVREGKEVSMSWYHDNRCHTTFVLGIGSGQAVVEQLPTKEWASSWLKTTVYVST